jgi:hypothetical protein
MTDAFKALYHPIPESVTGKSTSATSSRDSELKDFLQTHLASSEKNEIESEFKKTFPLHKQKVGKIKKPQAR